MMYATRIKMKPGCYSSQSLTEIDQIYIIGCDRPGYYKKGDVHDHLKQHPGSIKVNIAPYPNCVHATSVYGEKYVKSSPNQYGHDNLLNLPRE